MPVPPAPLGSSRSVGAPTARCLVRRTIRAVSTYTPGIVKIFRRAEANKLSGALERKFTRTSEQDRRTSRAASGSARRRPFLCRPAACFFSRRPDAPRAHVLFLRETPFLRTVRHKLAALSSTRWISSSQLWRAETTFPKAEGEATQRSLAIGRWSLRPNAAQTYLYCAAPSYAGGSQRSRIRPLLHPQSRLHLL